MLALLLVALSLGLSNFAAQRGLEYDVELGAADIPTGRGISRVLGTRGAALDANCT